AVRRWQLPLATSHVLALDSGEALHAWLKNGRLLTSLAAEARLRDPSSGNTLVLPPVVSERREAKVEFVGPVAESENGEVVACGLTDGQVAVWRLKEGIWEGFLIDAGPEVTALAIAGNGSMLVQGARDGSLRWWRTGDQTVVRNAQPHQGSVTAVIARPASAGFVTTSVDGTIQQWATNGAGGIISSVKGPIEGLSLNPEGSILLARSSARGSAVYVVATGVTIPVRYLSGPMHAIETAMFARGGKVVATLSADGAARTWDFLHRLLTNTVVVDLDGPTAIGPNGIFVAAAANTGVTKVWEIATGKLIAEFQDREQKVRALYWSPDGSSLLLHLGASNEIRMHRLPHRDKPEELQARLRAATKYCLPHQLRVRELGEDALLAHKGFSECVDTE
ncbi:MAG: WD40 repeat domain-containing protein, partial [Nannocystaceae bacterium]